MDNSIKSSVCVSYMSRAYRSERKCMLPLQRSNGKEEEPSKYRAACDYYQEAVIQQYEVTTL